MTAKSRHTWSETQHRRLSELGAEKAILLQSYDTTIGRDKAFQTIEKELVKSQRRQLQELLKRGGKTALDSLGGTISDKLTEEGFVKVVTPTVISAKALAKMTIDANHPLSKQIYWLNSNKCLRPMLAPNLYSLMQDFTRQSTRPIRFFEIGSCFRKETDGSNHTSEFTMLNLVEMGLSMDSRLERLKELGTLVLECAGLTDFSFEVETSDVYGTTLDIVDNNTSVELGSGAMGPHELDAAWEIDESWVGIGIGLERLLMLAQKDSSISRWCKSLAYLNGIRLKI